MLTTRHLVTAHLQDFELLVLDAGWRGDIGSRCCPYKILPGILSSPAGVLASWSVGHRPDPLGSIGLQTKLPYLPAYTPLARLLRLAGFGTWVK